MQKNVIDDIVIKRFIVGPLEVNCYLLTSKDAAILIDPGFASDELKESVQSLSKLQSRLVLLTHGHFDHSGFCPALQKAGWKVGIHPDDRFLLNHVPEDFVSLGYEEELFEPYMSYKNGWSYNIGSISLEVLHSPGHSPGSVCFIDNRRRFAFTGDTLFADSIGRTDLPGGNYNTLMQSLKKLTLLLETDTLILPGHGGRAKFNVVKRINRYLDEI